MKPKRQTVIYAIFACVLLAYMIVMVVYANRAERNEPFRQVHIYIHDPNHTEFIKEEDVYSILHKKFSGFDTLRHKNLNIYEVEQLLNENNRIEYSKCHILNDGSLRIDIEPLNPVARVFDSKGSVYVNASGKRVDSHPSFLVDVPVVTTSSVADSVMIGRLLPLLKKIKTDSEIDALISSLHIDGRGDIIIIPNVVGHVINFGDSTLIDNKFARLKIFYRDVMPVRGWNAFDTISVKWVGRVVATKRDKSVPAEVDLLKRDDIFDEALDDETMLPEQKM